MNDASKAPGAAPRTGLRLLAAVLVVVLAAGAGAGAGYWVVRGGIDLAPAAAREAEAREPGPVFALGSLTTNLSDQGRPRFIQVSIEIEAADEATLAELEARQGAVRDAVLRTLRSASAAELEGAQGIATLADRLRGAVGALLERGQVRNVYFQEFIIQ